MADDYNWRTDRLAEAEFPFPRFIETASIREIRRAVADHVTPLYVVGAGGTGKTSLLRLLQHEWQTKGLVSCFVELREIRDIEGLARAVLAQLPDPTAGNQTVIVESSSNESWTSTIDAIDTQNRGLLVLLDGLDETFNPEEVWRFVRAIAHRTSASVVVTGRQTLRFGSPDRQIHIAELAPFTEREARELITRFAANSVDPTLVQRAIEIAGGHPLATALVAAMISRGDRSFLQEPISSPEASISALMQRFIDRESLRLAISNEAHVHALAKLAIRENLQNGDVGFTPGEVDLLGTSSLVHRDGGQLSLIHPLVAPLVLNIAGVLPLGHTSFKEMAFGAEEAERDPLLTDNFISPAGTEELWAGTKNIVIGDRGSGKSALFASFAKVAATPQNEIRALRLEDPAELMLRLESSGEKLTSAEEFRAAWLLSLACCLAMQLSLNSERQRRLAAQLRAALPDAVPEGLAGRLVSLWYKLLRTTVKFKLGPIELEPAHAGDKARRGARAIDIVAFLQETAAALRSEGRRAIVAVDRIDEAYKYSRDVQERFVQGLFLAEGSLSKTPEIRLLIFIRTDLFEIYDIQEKNKLVSRTLRLRWSRDTLLRLTVRRILANGSLAGLAELLTSFEGDS